MANLTSFSVNLNANSVVFTFDGTLTSANANLFALGTNIAGVIDSANLTNATYTLQSSNTAVNINFSNLTSYYTVLDTFRNGANAAVSYAAVFNSAATSPSATVSSLTGATSFTPSTRTGNLTAFTNVYNYSTTSILTLTFDTDVSNVIVYPSNIRIASSTLPNANVYALTYAATTVDNNVLYITLSLSDRANILALNPNMLYSTSNTYISAVNNTFTDIFGNPIANISNVQLSQTSNITSNLSYQAQDVSYITQPADNLYILGGAPGQVLTTNGNGNVYWSSVGTASPAAGTNTQVQFNNNGSLGASAGLTFNRASNLLSVPGNIFVGNSNATNDMSITALRNMTLYSANAAGTGNINIVGNTVVTGNLQLGTPSSTGNLQMVLPVGLNIVTGQYLNTGNVSIGGNLDVTANILSYTGNVDAVYFNGNGAFLTNVPFSTAQAANYLPTYSGNLVSLAGNVNTTGNISAAANISAAYYIGNGSLLTGLSSNISVSLSNTTYNSLTTVSSTSGNTINVSSNYGPPQVKIGDKIRFGSASNATTYTVYTSTFNSGTNTTAFVLDNTPTGVVSQTIFWSQQPILLSNVLASGNNIQLTGNATIATINLSNDLAVNSASFRSNVSLGNLTTVGNATVGGNIVVGNVAVNRSLSAVANVSAGNVLTNNLLYANGVQWNFGLNLSVTLFSGSTSTQADIASNSDINILIPASQSPKNGDLFFDTSTRVNNTQPVYMYVNGNWRQILTAWGGN
jgi:hypothetical protein